MDALQAYMLHTALKSHFTTKYDFFKYQGKTRVNAATFAKNVKTKFHYAKLAAMHDPKGFIIANIVAGNGKKWIGELLNDSQAALNYTQWKKYREAQYYWFEEDLTKCLTNIDDNVRVKDSELPHLLKLYLQKKIALDTLIILNDLLDFFPMWNRKLKDDPLWYDIHFLCIKYKPFVQFDREKMLKIARKVFD